jgi:hypothetical protein
LSCPHADHIEGVLVKPFVVADTAFPMEPIYYLKCYSKCAFCTTVYNFNYSLIRVVEQLGTWMAQRTVDNNGGKVWAKGPCRAPVSMSSASLSKTAIIQCWFVPLRKG